jgi:hypothetical protein
VTIAWLLAVALVAAGTIAQAHVHLDPASGAACSSCAVAHERSDAPDAGTRWRADLVVVGAPVACAVGAPVQRSIATAEPRGPPFLVMAGHDSVTTPVG